MHRATAITAYTLQHNSTPPHSSRRALTNNKLTTAAPHVLHINNELLHNRQRQLSPPLWTSGVFGLGVVPFMFRATLHTHYTRRDNVYFVLVITILVDSSVVTQYQVTHGYI